MDRILLVTGQLAAAEVAGVAAKLKADVLVLPVNVAQFIGPDLAIEKLKPARKKYDKIIFPGLTTFDVSKVERAIRIPCFKGSENPSDLAELLLRKIPLSKTKSADSLLKKRGLQDYKKAEEEAERKPAKFRIGDLKVGQGFPPRIIAEIVDAPLLTKGQLLERARYYVDSGADIIDVGAIAGESNPKKLGDAVKFLKKKVKVPISIDSLNPEEINAGIRAGASLVLSLDGANLPVVDKKPSVAYVVIPGVGSGSLFKNAKDAKELGLNKIIADPILSPPFKMAGSLSRYAEFRRISDQPLLMGVANAIELMDMDSIGANGLLAVLAVELDISLILTTENSPKTRNSVKELKRAVQMAFLAKKNGTMPKNLGFDLLLAKGKSKGVLPAIKGARKIKNSRAKRFKPDRKGCFTIFVDLDRNKIIAAHSKNALKRYDKIFEGISAEEISKMIAERKLVSDLSHMAYLGRELQKAEMCLKLGRGYVQDKDFPAL